MTNQWHPTEDDLVLLFYGDTGEGDTGEKVDTRLTEHLALCVTCRSTWHEIQSTLQTVDAAGIPEPAAGFERVMWARVQAALPEPPARRAWWSMRQWMPLAGIAALVTATFFVGRFLNSPTVVEVSAPSARASERALLIAMDDHLERSQLLLVELMNAPADGPLVGFERAAAEDLVAASRLYRQTAAQTGELQLASMLEDLERVLVELASGPDELNRKDLNALRARISEEDLLFRVRVVSDDVRGRQRTISTVTEGEDR